MLQALIVISFAVALLRWCNTAAAAARDFILVLGCQLLLGTDNVLPVVMKRSGAFPIQVLNCADGSVCLHTLLFPCCFDCYFVYTLTHLSCVARSALHCFDPAAKS